MELIQAQGELIKAQQDAIAVIVEDVRKLLEAQDKHMEDIVKSHQMNIKYLQRYIDLTPKT